MKHKSYNLTLRITSLIVAVCFTYATLSQDLAYAWQSERSTLNRPLASGNFAGTSIDSEVKSVKQNFKEAVNGYSSQKKRKTRKFTTEEAMSKIIDLYIKYTKSGKKAGKISREKGLYAPAIWDDLVRIFKAIGVNGKKFIDLGSGDGRVALSAACFGADKAVGWEWEDDLSEESWYFKEKAISQNIIDKEKVKFIKGDFLTGEDKNGIPVLDEDSDLSNYDVVFYSMSGTRDESKLQEKILKELKPGAIFVVYLYAYVSEREPFPKLAKAEGYDDIANIARVYTKPKKENIQPKKKLAKTDTRLQQERQPVTKDLFIKDIDGPQPVRLYLDKDILTKLPQKVIKRIEETVSWKFMNPDKLSGDRSVILDLPEPIKVNGVLIRSIKIKGICYKEAESSSLSSPKMEVYEGRGRPPKDVEFRGGIIHFTEPEDNPKGALRLKKAINEYKMGYGLFRKGVSVNYPIGYGKFLSDDMRFNNEEVGFVVEGMIGSDERLLDLIAGSTSSLISNVNNPSYNQEDKIAYGERILELLEEALKVYGRGLRGLHDAGFIHRYATIDNVFISNGNCIFYDLDNVIQKAGLTLDDSIGYTILDIYNALESITDALDLLIDSKLFNIDKSVLHSAFLRGYFYDRLKDIDLSKIKPAEVINEDVKKPVSSIDSYIVKLAHSIYLSELSKPEDANITPHHFPLYIWQKLRSILERAVKDKKITKTTFDIICHNALGVARLDDKGDIVIEKEALKIITRALNKILDRGPPTAKKPDRKPKLTIDDVKNYLTYHEVLHKKIREILNTQPDFIDNLLAQLQKLPNYKEIKAGFLNNYGMEYRINKKFAQELLVVYMTETALLKQPVRLLFDTKDAKNRKSIDDFQGLTKLLHEYALKIGATTETQAVSPKEKEQKGVFLESLIGSIAGPLSGIIELAGAFLWQEVKLPTLPRMQDISKEFKKDFLEKNGISNDKINKELLLHNFEYIKAGLKVSRSYGLEDMFLNEPGLFKSSFKIGEKRLEERFKENIRLIIKEYITLIKSGEYQKNQEIRLKTLDKLTKAYLLKPRLSTFIVEEFKLQLEKDVSYDELRGLFDSFIPQESGISVRYYGGDGIYSGGTVIEDSIEGSRIMTDFGINMNEEMAWFDQIYKGDKISNTGLRARQLSGLVPNVMDWAGKILTSIYRKDLIQMAKPYLWISEKQAVDGVLITHTHYDHIANIAFLDPSIPIYVSPESWAFLKMLNDSSPDVKREIFEYEDRQTGEVKKRDIRVFEYGVPFKVGKFEVIALPVDHTAVGSCAFLIKTREGWIVDPGDLRMNWDKDENGNFVSRNRMTEAFLDYVEKLKAKGENISMLSMEFTNHNREHTKITEKEAAGNIKKVAIRANKNKGLVIMTYDIHNVARLGNILEVAKELGRKVIISIKEAYLLWHLKEALFRGTIRRFSKENNIQDLDNIVDIAQKINTFLIGADLGDRGTLKDFQCNLIKGTLSNYEARFTELVLIDFLKNLKAKYLEYSKAKNKEMVDQIEKIQNTIAGAMEYKSFTTLTNGIGLERNEEEPHVPDKRMDNLLKNKEASEIFITWIMKKLDKSGYIEERLRYASAQDASLSGRADEFVKILYSLNKIDNATFTKIRGLFKELEENYEYPDIEKDESLLVYIPRKKTGTYTTSDYRFFEQKIMEHPKIKERLITKRGDMNPALSISQDRDKYILMLNSNSLSELVEDIKRARIDEYIVSHGPPFVVDFEISEEKARELLSKLNINWNEGELFHASGHLDRGQSIDVLKRIGAQIVALKHAFNRADLASSIQSEVSGQIVNSSYGQRIDVLKEDSKVYIMPSDIFERLSPQSKNFIKNLTKAELSSILYDISSNKSNVVIYHEVREVLRTLKMQARVFTYSNQPDSINPEDVKERLEQLKKYYRGELLRIEIQKLMGCNIQAELDEEYRALNEVMFKIAFRESLNSVLEGFTEMLYLKNQGTIPKIRCRIAAREKLKNLRTHMAFFGILPKEAKIDALPLFFAANLDLSQSGIQKEDVVLAARCIYATLKQMGLAVSTADNSSIENYIIDIKRSPLPEYLLSQKGLIELLVKEKENLIVHGNKEIIKEVKRKLRIVYKDKKISLPVEPVPEKPVQPQEQTMEPIVKDQPQPSESKVVQEYLKLEEGKPDAQFIERVSKLLKDDAPKKPQGSITFYGGPNRIGGNTIMLEWNQNKMLLDVGGGEELRGDLFSGWEGFRMYEKVDGSINTDVLPWFPDGVYRKDMLKGMSGIIPIESRGIKAVIVSHSHLDHIDLLYALDPSILIICSEEVRAALETTQWQYAGRIESEYIEMKDRTDMTRSQYPVIPRNFMTFKKNQSFKVGDFTFHPYRVGHSVFSDAFAIDTPMGRIVYTGDLRFHDDNEKETRHFVDDVANGPPVLALITEGVNVREKEKDKVHVVKSEAEYKKYLEDIFDAAKGKAIFSSFNAMNLDRFLTVLEATKKKGRKLVITIAHAYYLRKLKEIGYEIPASFIERLKKDGLNINTSNLLNDPDILIHIPQRDRDNNMQKFIDTLFGYTTKEGNYVFGELSLDKKITSEEIGKRQAELFVTIRLSQFSELDDIRPIRDSVFVYSSGEAFSKEMEKLHKKVDMWVKRCGMVQENLLYLTPHAWEKDIIDMVERINPKYVLPIHTEEPQRFIELMPHRRGIIIPRLFKSYPLLKEEPKEKLVDSLLDERLSPASRQCLLQMTDTEILEMLRTLLQEKDELTYYKGIHKRLIDIKKKMRQMGEGVLKEELSEYFQIEKLRLELQIIHKLVSNDAIKQQWQVLHQAILKKTIKLAAAKYRANKKGLSVVIAADFSRPCIDLGCGEIAFVRAEEGEDAVNFYNALKMAGFTQRILRGIGLDISKDNGNSDFLKSRLNSLRYWPIAYSKGLFTDEAGNTISKKQVTGFIYGGNKPLSNKLENLLTQQIKAFVVAGGEPRKTIPQAGKETLQKPRPTTPSLEEKEKKIEKEKMSPAEKIETEGRLWFLFEISQPVFIKQLKQDILTRFQEKGEGIIIIEEYLADEILNLYRQAAAGELSPAKLKDKEKIDEVLGKPKHKRQSKLNDKIYEDLQLLFLMSDLGVKLDIRVADVDIQGKKLFEDYNSLIEKAMTEFAINGRLEDALKSMEEALRILIKGNTLRGRQFIEYIKKVRQENKGTDILVIRGISYSFIYPIIEEIIKNQYEATGQKMPDKLLQEDFYYNSYVPSPPDEIMQAVASGALREGVSEEEALENYKKIKDDGVPFKDMLVRCLVYEFIECKYMPYNLEKPLLTFANDLSNSVIRKVVDRLSYEDIAGLSEFLKVRLQLDDEKEFLEKINKELINAGKKEDRDRINKALYLRKDTIAGHILEWLIFNNKIEKTELTYFPTVNLFIKRPSTIIRDQNELTFLRELANAVVKEAKEKGLAIVNTQFIKQVALEKHLNPELLCDLVKDYELTAKKLLEIVNAQKEVPSLNKKYRADKKLADAVIEEAKEKGLATMDMQLIQEVASKGRLDAQSLCNLIKDKELTPDKLLEIVNNEKALPNLIKKRQSSNEKITEEELDAIIEYLRKDLAATPRELEAKEQEIAEHLRLAYESGILTKDLVSRLKTHVLLNPLLKNLSLIVEAIEGNKLYPLSRLTSETSAKTPFESIAMNMIGGPIGLALSGLEELERYFSLKDLGPQTHLRQDGDNQEAGLPSEASAKEGFGEQAHHFQLYLWKVIKRALLKAYIDKKISKDVCKRIIIKGQGLARIDKGKIRFEHDKVLKIVLYALNSQLKRGPPITLNELKNYLATHERFHQRIRQLLSKDPALLKTLQLQLLAKLGRDKYRTLKETFANNYGKEYNQKEKDLLFVEELLVVYLTETKLKLFGGLPQLLSNQAKELKEYRNLEYIPEEATGLLQDYAQKILDASNLEEVIRNKLSHPSKRLKNARILRRIYRRPILLKKAKEKDLSYKTYYSDGANTPTGIVFDAWKKGIQTIAIADRNSFEGIYEAMLAGEIFGVRVIPAIEVDTFDESLPKERRNPRLLIYLPQLKNKKLLKDWLDGVWKTGEVNLITNKKALEKNTCPSMSKVIEFALRHEGIVLIDPVSLEFASIGPILEKYARVQRGNKLYVGFSGLEKETEYELALKELIDCMNKDERLYKKNPLILTNTIRDLLDKSQEIKDIRYRQMLFKVLLLTLLASLPKAAVSDTVKVKDIDVQHFRKANLSIQAVKVNIEGELEARPVLAKGGIGSVETLSSMVKRAAGLAGINANFFDWDSRQPLNLVLIDGRPVYFCNADPARTLFVVTQDGTPYIGTPTDRIEANIKINDKTVRVQGANIPIRENWLVIYNSAWGKSTENLSTGEGSVIEYVVKDGKIVGINKAGNTQIPEDGYVISIKGKSRVDAFIKKVNIESFDGKTNSEFMFDYKGLPGDLIHAVGLGPRLLEGGKVVVGEHIEKEGMRSDVSSSRTNRAAIGITPEGKVLLVEVKGPASLYDLANIMLEQGAVDAVATDGGGSAEVLVKDEKTGYLRPIPVGVVITEEKPKEEEPKPAPKKPSSLDDKGQDAKTGSVIQKSTEDGENWPYIILSSLTSLPNETLLYLILTLQIFGPLGYGIAKSLLSALKESNLVIKPPEDAIDDTGVSITTFTNAHEAFSDISALLKEEPTEPIVTKEENYKQSTLEAGYIDIFDSLIMKIKELLSGKRKIGKSASNYLSNMGIYTYDEIESTLLGRNEEIDEAQLGIILSIILIPDLDEIAKISSYLDELELTQDDVKTIEDAIIQARLITPIVVEDDKELVSLRLDNREAVNYYLKNLGITKRLSRGLLHKIKECIPITEQDKIKALFRMEIGAKPQEVSTALQIDKELAAAIILDVLKISGGYTFERVKFILELIKSAEHKKQKAYELTELFNGEKDYIYTILAGSFETADKRIRSMEDSIGLGGVLPRYLSPEDIAIFEKKIELIDEILRDLEYSGYYDIKELCKYLDPEEILHILSYGKEVLPVLLDKKEAIEINELDEENGWRIDLIIEKLDFMTGKDIKLQHLGNNKWIVYHEERVVERLTEEEKRYKDNPIAISWIIREAITDTNHPANKALGFKIEPGPQQEKIKDLVMITFNRPQRLNETLNNYIDNLLRFNHSDVVITIVDASGKENAEENINIISKLKTRGISIRYIGRSDLKKFKEELINRFDIKKVGLSKEKLKSYVNKLFAANIGGIRNFISLYFAGKRIITVDDDSLPQIRTINRVYRERIKRVISGAYHKAKTDGSKDTRLVSEIVGDYLEQNLPSDFKNLLGREDLPEGCFGIDQVGLFIMQFYKHSSVYPFNFKSVNSISEEIAIDFITCLSNTLDDSKVVIPYVSGEVDGPSVVLLEDFIDRRDDPDIKQYYNAGFRLRHIFLVPPSEKIVKLSQHIGEHPIKGNCLTFDLTKGPILTAPLRRGEDIIIEPLLYGIFKEEKIKLAPIALNHERELSDRPAAPENFFEDALASIFISLLQESIEEIQSLSTINERITTLIRRIEEIKINSLPEFVEHQISSDWHRCKEFYENAKKLFEEFKNTDPSRAKLYKDFCDEMDTIFFISNYDKYVEEVKKRLKEYLEGFSATLMVQKMFIASNLAKESTANLGSINSYNEESHQLFRVDNKTTKQIQIWGNQIEGTEFNQGYSDILRGLLPDIPKDVNIILIDRGRSPPEGQHFLYYDKYQQKWIFSHAGTRNQTGKFIYLPLKAFEELIKTQKGKGFLSRLIPDEAEHATAKLEGRWTEDFHKDKDNELRKFVEENFNSKTSAETKKGILTANHKGVPTDDKLEFFKRIRQKISQDGDISIDLNPSTKMAIMIDEELSMSSLPIASFYDKPREKILSGYSIEEFYRLANLHANNNFTDSIKYYNAFISSFVEMLNILEDYYGFIEALDEKTGAYLMDMYKAEAQELYRLIARFNMFDIKDAEELTDYEFILASYNLKDALGLLKKIQVQCSNAHTLKFISQLRDEKIFGQSKLNDLDTKFIVDKIYELFIRFNKLVKYSVEILNSNQPKHLFEKSSVKVALETMLDNLRVDFPNVNFNLKCNYDITLSKISLRELDLMLTEAFKNALTSLNFGKDPSIENPNITIEIKKEKGKVIVKVIDNGFGIPYEDLINIFNIGYSEKSYPKNPYSPTSYVKGGFGLGLPKILEAVKFCHGDVEVITKVKDGQTNHLKFINGKAFVQSAKEDLGHTGTAVIITLPTEPTKEEILGNPDTDSVIVATQQSKDDTKVEKTALAFPKAGLIQKVKDALSNYSDEDFNKEREEDSQVRIWQQTSPANQEAVLYDFTGKEVTWDGRVAMVDIGDGDVMAVKFVWENQDPYLLEREAQLMEEVRRKGILHSKPRPLSTQEGKYVYKFKGELTGLPSDIKLNPEKYAICYVAPKEYFEYRPPAEGPYPKRVSELKTYAINNAEDLANLLISGYVHTSVSAISHRGGVAAGTRWVWDHQPGRTGRFEMLKTALKSPNIRVIGIADFEHIEPIDMKYLPHCIGQMLCEWTLIVVNSCTENGLDERDTRDILVKGLRRYLSILLEESEAMNLSNESEGLLLDFVSTFRKNLSRLDKDLPLAEMNNLTTEISQPLIKVLEEVISICKDTKFYKLNAPAYLEFGSSGKGKGQFYGPAGMAIDKYGDIYVVDTYNHRVQKFTKDGKFILEFGSEGIEGGQFSYPTDIAIDEENDIYIADTNNNRIQKFKLAENGEIVFVAEFGSKGKAKGQFYHPTGIVVDKEGNILVVDTYNCRVQKFRFAEENKVECLMEFGSFGKDKGQFQHPEAMAVDEEGDIYIADSFNHRIQKFDKDGKFILEFGSYGANQGQLDRPAAIAFDNDGTVLVLDRLNDRIQRFAKDGKFISQFGSSGIGLGSLGWPAGIVIDEEGNIYVTDAGNNRIQLIQKSILSNKTSKKVSLEICNLCGEAGAEILFSKKYKGKSYDLVKCEGCSLTRIDPMPSDEELREIYSSGEYFKGSGEIGYTDYFGETYRKEGIDAADGFVRFILEYSKAGEGGVLDVGCGGGDIVEASQNLGWQAKGIEPSKTAADFASKKGLDVVNMTLKEAYENKEIAKEEFDIVTFDNVFEHLRDPDKTLGIVNEVLKDGGIVALVLANIDSHVFKTKKADTPFIAYDHLYYFSEETMTKILEKNGFEVLDIFFISPHIRRDMKENNGARYGIKTEEELAQIEMDGRGEFMKVIARKVTKVSQKMNTPIEPIQGSDDKDFRAAIESSIGWSIDDIPPQPDYIEQEKFEVIRKTQLTL